jgi:hypothetical protein
LLPFFGRWFQPELASTFSMILSELSNSFVEHRIQVRDQLHACLENGAYVASALALLVLQGPIVLPARLHEICMLHDLPQT